jgi:glycosyltransferase involved in cell wall biosynthesis
MSTTRRKWLDELEAPPDHAPVELIDEDVDEDAIAGLYRACDALVAPSRGEGFGLPLAEAMLHGLPVITTRHGGALDFCSDDTAWLVDFDYRYSQSHLGLFNSVWAEPVLDDLARVLREVHDCPAAVRAEKTGRARARVERTFTWSKVAQRTREAVARLDTRPAVAALPKVALVSTWNMRCGIASYARHQTSAFPRGSLQVFASHCEERLQADEAFVQRCWRQGWDDELEDLYRALRLCKADIVVIQFNFGFFDIEALGRLLDRLTEDGVRCHVVLHSTMDVKKPERSISLQQIRGALGHVARLLVHGAVDLNRLKHMGLDANAAIIPHGVPAPRTGDGSRARVALNLSGRRVIGCFGYMLPDKGFSVLIDAFLQLRERHEELHLLLVTPLFPAPVSHQELEKCRALIAGHPQGSSVTLVTAYLEEEQVHELLQAMDLLVFPYQQTQESSSGAVRFGLAAQKPVACTPLPIFDDIASIVHRLPGRSSDELARGIEALLADPDRMGCHAERQATWLRDHDWPAASLRFWNMLRTPPILDLVALDRDADA